MFISTAGQCANNHAHRTELQWSKTSSNLTKRAFDCASNTYFCRPFYNFFEQQVLKIRTAQNQGYVRFMLNLEKPVAHAF